MLESRGLWLGRGLVCDNAVETGNPTRCIIVIQWPVIYLISELFMIYLSSGAATCGGWRAQTPTIIYLTVSSRELFVVHADTDFELGTILRTPVLGERKVCFCSPKMYQNSPTAIQNSKILRGQYPVLGERRVCFRSPKMYQNSTAF